MENELDWQPIFNDIYPIPNMFIFMECAISKRRKNLDIQDYKC